MMSPNSNYIREYIRFQKISLLDTFSPLLAIVRYSLKYHV
jgi:hypothetical protein